MFMRESNFYKLLATIKEEVFSKESNDTDIKLDEISLVPTGTSSTSTGTAGITPDQLNAALIGMSKKPGMSPTEEDVAAKYLEQIGIRPRSTQARNAAASFGNLVTRLTTNTALRK